MIEKTLLSIGNSFSQDAQRYLHDMAALRGVSLNCVNLFIAGCPLERHFRNMVSGQAVYALEINGCPTGFSVSLEQALTANRYDYVTLQQASRFSFDEKSYFPYLQQLADRVRYVQPQATLAMHCTWAYQEGSDLLHGVGFAHEAEMYGDICRAYASAAERIGADTVIPCGPAMHLLSESGIIAHRDTFHAHLGYGRYMLSLVWLGSLLGLSPADDTFDRFDVPVQPEQATAARIAAQKAVDHALSRKKAGKPYDFFAL